MKKILSIVLALITVVAVFASCDKKETEKANKNEGGKPSASEPSIVMWTEHSYDKLRTEMKAPSEPQTEYTVSLAKNESEAVNIGLRSDSDTALLNFKILSGENEHIKVNVFHVMEILKLKRKQWTDPAAPLGPGKRFKLEKDKTMAVLADFTTTADTPAGDYVYELGITDRSGKVLNKVTITVHVWNFAMPEGHKFESAVGSNGNVEHYEMLLEHNLSAYDLPYDILDPQADAYMSDPRVTSFRIPFYNGDTDYEEKLKAIYEKLKTNEVWFNKAYFYPIDEPSTMEHLADFEKLCKELRELCPGIKITSPYYKNLQITDDLDQIDFMDKYIDLHCPKLANWDEDQIYDANQMAKYPTFDERMKALQNKGETVWAYVCNYPLAPYLNVKVDDEGIVSRVLFWQFYQRDIDGFLYWHSSYYAMLGNGGNPWDSVDTFNDGIYGDGILIYTGTGAGLSKLTPVGSIRLKIIRDGIDDIELLYMAEEAFGREWVDERVNKVSKSLTSVDISSDAFAALRIEIAEALEAKLNEK